MRRPSFVLAKEYKGKVPVYHFDIHRLDGVRDIETVGYEDFFYGNGVSLIEWADKITEILPDKYIEIHITIKDENTRSIVVSGLEFK